MKFLLAEEHAALAKQLHDISVGVENVFTGEFRQVGFVSELAVIIHRRQDWQFICAAEIVIVLAVAGSDVHRARSRIHGYEVRHQHDRFAVEKGMSRNDFVDLTAGK